MSLSQQPFANKAAPLTLSLRGAYRAETQSFYAGRYAGIYFADTQYRGRYAGYAPVYGVGYVVDNGSVNGNADNGSFIGSVKLGLDKDLGWGSIGAFGQAEYLSYVPKVIYNNNDAAGGAPWGIAGSTGTRVSSSEAMNYTVGVSVSFKLNRLY